MTFSKCFISQIQCHHLQDESSGREDNPKACSSQGRSSAMLQPTFSSQMPALHNNIISRLGTWCPAKLGKGSESGLSDGGVACSWSCRVVYHRLWCTLKKHRDYQQGAVVLATVEARSMLVKKLCVSSMYTNFNIVSVWP